MSNDAFDFHDLDRLVGEANGPCVSLYLPTYRAGIETLQNPIRLKNLLREADTQLQRGGLREPAVRDLLAPAQALIDNADFWQHQSDGLAVFCAQSGVSTYRLPVAVDELTVVASAFHVKPLLQLLSGDGSFHILALGIGEVRLWAATRYSVEAVELPDGFPKSQDEALQYDDPERQSQFHTQGPSQGQQRGATFFGHGGMSDSANNDMLRYCQIIDQHLREQLGDARGPLVLAAVEYIHPIFREASSSRELVSEGIVGSPDQLRPDELHTRAWALVEPQFAEARRASIEQYHALLGTGRASGDLHTVLRAAARGRIATLIVGVGIQEWGTYDMASDALTRLGQGEAGARDLLDVCAVQTLSHGGEVYAVPSGDVPGGGTVAGVFRY